MRLALALAVALLAAPAAADVLRVGEGAAHKTIADAVRASTDGDTIEISEGEYYECASIRHDKVVLVGLGNGAVFTDTTCAGKAQLIITGNDVTIRNITFTRARVNDANGAGIRAEGRNLTVERSRFIDNQTAILGAPSQHSIITIKNSTFEANGVCPPGRGCLASVTVPGIARLRIEDSSFTGSRGGPLLHSQARRTEVVNSRFADGPSGRASGLIVATVGALVLDDNQFEKTAAYDDHQAAVLLFPSDAPLGEILMRRNSYTNLTGTASAFVKNWSGGAIRVEGNRIPDGDTEVTSDGALRYAAGAYLRHTREAAGEAWRGLKSGLRLLSPF